MESLRTKAKCAREKGKESQLLQPERYYRPHQAVQLLSTTGSTSRNPYLSIQRYNRPHDRYYRPACAQ